MLITRSILLALALAFLALPASNYDDDRIASATLLVVNESDFAIVELYLAEIGSPTFGRNLLGADPLLPGEELLLGVSCGFFDVLLIDEDGVDCEIPAVDLCLNDAVFIIRNTTCTVFEADKARSFDRTRDADARVRAQTLQASLP